MKRRLQRIRRLARLRERLADGAKLALARAISEEEAARRTCAQVTARLDGIEPVRDRAESEVWMGRRALQNRTSLELIGAQAQLEEASAQRAEKRDELLAARREHEKLEKLRTRMAHLLEGLEERRRQAEDEELHRLVTLGRQTEDLRRRRRGKKETGE